MKKKTYALPFVEVQRGFYYIEADNIEEARAIVIEGDFTGDLDPLYDDGTIDYDENELIEVKEEKE